MDADRPVQTVLHIEPVEKSLFYCLFGCFSERAFFCPGKTSKHLIICATKKLTENGYPFVKFTLEALVIMALAW